MRVFNQLIIALTLGVLLLVCPEKASCKDKRSVENKSPKEQPGGPENKPAEVVLEDKAKGLILRYNGCNILEGSFNSKVDVQSTVNGDEKIEQHISLSLNKNKQRTVIVYGSSEALAAETRGKVQEKFALVRTSHGLSNNLRNNAVYDRTLDWMIEAPEGTIIKSDYCSNGMTKFELTFPQDEVELVFRPRYYNKHKNLPYYQPWTYQVYKESITGWCSWWAYFRNFNEKNHHDLLKMWKDKHFEDYGYRFIQIDDVYQGEHDRGRENCEVASGYLGGRPTTWLDWKKDRFPSGLTGYVKSVKEAGFSPAIWMGSFFSDKETAELHPDWFVQDKDGKAAGAPWVSYVMNATKDEVVEALIRPTFKGLKNAGVEYVKIDQLRHYLYDNLHNNLNWCREKGIQPGEVLRAYLRVAREELGDDTFILSCWGVLPESIGLADACRIGGDGYGPVTMQQYNSWNGIVWRNDPDHCDVMPNKQAKDVGNVKETAARKASSKESIIRPALASVAGAMLMLSDKPETYQNDANLYGLRRSSPVVFSVPGQLYDFDPAKTDWLKTHERTEIISGKHPTPIDGDQFGYVCPYWLNEFNLSFENWNVLHRLNWSDKKKTSLEAEVIDLKDLGLDPKKEYLCYEFWQEKFYGVVKHTLKLGKLEALGIESIAIREKLNRPQLLSTNRHLSQGAVEIEKLVWINSTLQGRSRVVIDDEYIITLYVPDGYALDMAQINGMKAKVQQTGNIVKLSYMPTETSSVMWNVKFNKNTTFEQP
ncbi:hypothetical protein EYV94_18285 [Puteibacter caeruleilacunae]|nr:hypothetical protein EYV94_18285 [Puteibacter caeruleilacunae]